MSKYPKISIVIPTLNQCEYIEQTITSILGQFYPNLELIIIDGGSIDNTSEIIDKYEKYLNYYVSEKDDGQSHAINKGFKAANGDIMAWLNSDDYYIPMTLFKVAEILNNINSPKFLYGSCLAYNQNSKKANYRETVEFDPDKLTYFDYLVQPSTFWTRKLWEKVGEIDQSYHYVMDWDWFIRASKYCDFTVSNDVLSVYRRHPNHKTSYGGVDRAKEILSIVDKYADKKWKKIYSEVYTTMYDTKQHNSTSISTRIHRKISRVFNFNSLNTIKDQSFMHQIAFDMLR